MSAPKAPLAHIIRCQPGRSFSDVAQSHHAAMEYKIDFQNADDGTGLCLILWSGANSFKASLEAGSFLDRQRILQRRVASSVHMDVTGCDSFEECTLADAKAILMVTGVPQDESAGLGEAFASIPKTVGKLSFKSTAFESGKKVITGCYCFASQQDMDEYVASDAFATARAEAPWEADGVKIERLVLPTPIASAAAA